MSDDNSGIVYGPDGSVTIGATCAKASTKKEN
jgi:hypothetical protein